MKTITKLVLVSVLLFAAVASAEEISGVVTSVNVDEKSFTVRNEATGRFRTYFVNSTTAIRGDTGELTIADLKRGDVVRLTYTNADTGREITSAERLSTNAEVPAVSTEEYKLVGEIIGVRPALRAITVREDVTGQKITVRLTEDAKVFKDGRSVDMAKLARGDEIAGRYRMTDQGPILITKAPEQFVEVESHDHVTDVAMVALPGTASNASIYLILGVLSLIAGIAVSARRA